MQEPLGTGVASGSCSHRGGAGPTGPSCEVGASLAGITLPRDQLPVERYRTEAFSPDGELTTSLYHREGAE